MADKYGRTMYQIMLENGATEDELRQQLSGTGTPQSYIDREAQKAAAAAAAQPTYSLPSQWFDGMSRIGEAQGWKIDDSNSATWQKIAQLANSGNTQGAIDLANQLSAAGQFGGYYDDAGNYWGFAQGYTGGANASMQPVIGGKILTPKGLEYENTNVWLTPDGKALNYGQGGTLTNNGETWGTTDNRNAQAVGRWYDENGTDSKDARWNTWDAVGARMGWTPEETFANMSKSGAFLNPELNDNGSGSTPYQQALNNYNGTSAGNYTPTQPVSYQEYLNQNGGSKPASLSAPSAYDPNSDTLWQQYLKDWANKQAPEYAGDPYQAQRDAALAAYGEKWGGSEYQPLRDQYLQNAANMKWDYNPDTDPVWQAYQKQYRREGQRATEDTLGRYAAMTGGMPSTAAVTAASQAGDYYASQLSDKLPQLYQDAYNRYLQEYQRQLGLSDAYAGFDNTEYQRWLQGQQQNLDLANAYNQYGQLDYQKYLDQLGQFNTDRNFNYNAARDNQQLGRQAVEDQYKRYLDALSQANYEDETAYSRYRDTISDQRYDQEWAQKLRAYADEQNWKAAEWQQYLREYGDKLSQTEKEWAWEQAQQAAKYGDYSGLESVGIDTSSANPKEAAYASDGSMYKFNTQDALYFVKNAPNGTPGNPTTMTGSDGSTWKKDEYGNVTITTQNGKTFTYSNNTPAVTGSGKSSGTGRGSGSGGSGSGGSDNDAMSRMSAAGISSEGEAYNWLLANGYGVTAAGKLAKYYAESLGNNNGSSYSDDDVSRAWDIINGKYPNANQAVVTWAQQVLSQTSGLDFGTGGNNEGSVNDPTYANLEESLDRMAANNRSRDEIFAEIDGEVRDGRITKAQGDALKQKYYGGTDNVPNVGKHSDGRPQSSGFSSVLQQADTLYGSRGDLNGAIDAIRKAYESGLIHEYEIDIIMDRLGL